MPTTHWESEPYKIRYHFSCLERFDLQKRLNLLKTLLRLQIVFSGTRRKRDGNGFQARKRRFMGLWLTFRCIEDVSAELFLKRNTILYPSFEFYPGTSTDPF